MSVSPSVSQILEDPWVERINLLLTGQPSIRREICLCAVWSWDYPPYILVLGKILPNVKQFGPLCFLYMNLISLMDIFPHGKYTAMIHTPENLVIATNRDQNETEQGINV